MLALGIDLGTSKVAISIIDSAGTQVHTASRAHTAVRAAPSGHSEQDAERIIACAEALVREIPPAIQARVAALGFTGQMHGVVLHDEQQKPLSPLVTWQDRRVLEDPAFLTSLGSHLHPGYGLATLAWWASRGELPGHARAATIHGLLAARWGSMKRAPIDMTDMQAWGGRTPVRGVSETVCPQIYDHGACVGTLVADLGLPRGIPLAAPLGDNQASLRATLTDPEHELAFTLGTGCQLSAIVRRGSHAPTPQCDVRPFDATHDALVAAPLTGGAAWLWLAEIVASWISDVGLVPPSRDALLLRLDELGLAAADKLDFKPHLAGERHDSALRGRLDGLAFDRGRLGEVARALARGLAAVPRNMLPPETFAQRTRVMASGNALRQSRLLRTMAEIEFGLPLVVTTCREEAATGAARVALELCRPA